MEREIWDEEFHKLTELLRYFQREPAANPLTDITPGDGSTADYAEAMAAITIAMSHLTEAIPNRQPNRIRAAFALLQMGKRALGNFLESRNVL